MYIKSWYLTKKRKSSSNSVYFSLSHNPLLPHNHRHPPPHSHNQTHRHTHKRWIKRETSETRTSNCTRIWNVRNHRRSCFDYPRNDCSRVIRFRFYPCCTIYFWITIFRSWDLWQVTDLQERTIVISWNKCFLWQIECSDWDPRSHRISFFVETDDSWSWDCFLWVICVMQWERGDTRYEETSRARWRMGNETTSYRASRDAVTMPRFHLHHRDPECRDRKNRTRTKPLRNRLTKRFEIVLESDRTFSKSFNLVLRKSRRRRVWKRTRQ